MHEYYLVIRDMQALKKNVVSISRLIFFKKNLRLGELKTTVKPLVYPASYPLE